MAKYNKNDRVFFHLNDKKYEYRVASSFLSNCSGCNSEIFIDLGMNESAKMDFCSIAYGYQAGSGTCPTCRPDDYEALSRLIEAIEAECTGQPKTYKELDHVIFTVDGKDYKYTVENGFLSNTEGDNDSIFKVLGLDKDEFCDEAYGYNNLGGLWPECKTGDFAALTRVIRALQEEIAKKEVGTLGDLEELRKLKDQLLLDKVKEQVSHLYYNNIDKIVCNTPIVFSIRECNYNYRFTPTWITVDDWFPVESNSVIFKKLGIDPSFKQKLASACYGYDALEGAWPDYHPNDIEALLRFLYVLSKEYYVRITIAEHPLSDFIRSEPYDRSEPLTTTSLVDRPELLNHRSPEVSLTINHFSLKF